MVAAARSSLTYALIAVLFVLVAGWQTAYSVHMVGHMMHAETEVARPFSLRTASHQLGLVSPEASTAGLRPDDVVMDINGHAVGSEAELAKMLQEMHPGGKIMVHARHAGQSRDEMMPVQLKPMGPVTVRGWLVSIILYIVTPASCILLGFGVLAIRPRDPVAWLLLLLMLSFSLMSLGDFSTTVAWSWPALVRAPALVYDALLGSSWTIWILLFGIYFPTRLEFDRRWPWVKWILIAPVAVATIAEVILLVGDSENFAAVASFRNLLLGVRKPYTLEAMAGVWGFFLALNMKLRGAAPDAKRRLRLTLWGSAVALTPLFFIAVAASIQGWDKIPEYALLPCILILAVFPLTLAYVIVVERALDLRVVLRQGLQYALARNAVQVLRWAILAAVIYIGTQFIEHPGQNSEQRLIVIAVGVFVVLRVRQAGDRLRRWVDRRFFREAYNAEQILSELSDNVRSIVETRSLLETVARKIEASLHVERIAMLVGSSGRYVPAYALGYAAAPAVSFEEEAVTVKQLRRRREPLKVYLDSPDSWIYQEAKLGDGERGQLQLLDTRLLLPLSFREKLGGFISLGAKRSEEPYSKSDLQLLALVATQTGMALENSQLAQAIANEVAKRERLNRELEIAREVQERLFPQCYPTAPGLSYAGLCRPALGVGGDYYDFLEIPGAQYGFAVGDVSGKGVSAALLMACLQASLRGQTIGGASDLACLMVNLNRLIFNATPSNRYATFFYSQYDPATRRLRYVNAGHNPPMLFRGEQVLRLEEGGPVVGLFKVAPYKEASVTLQAGDILVLYTDGISEAMNAADEEWEEERLIAAVRDCMRLGPKEMIGSLLRAADAFVAGAPQHDDMTLVVVKAAT
jgi:sigma-B regulation protein RsbU (phosphoserine phosphatase)